MPSKRISLVVSLIVIVLASIVLTSSIGNLQKIDKQQQVLDDQLKALQIINNTMNNGTISPSRANTMLTKLEQSRANSSSINSGIQTIKAQRPMAGYEKPPEHLTTAEGGIKEARNETVRECVPIAYKWNGMEDERNRGVQYSEEGNIVVSETQEQLNVCDSSVTQIEQLCDSDGLCYGSAIAAYHGIRNRTALEYINPTCNQPQNYTSTISLLENGKAGFSPKELTIHGGDYITFKSNDTKRHSLVSSDSAMDNWFQNFGRTLEPNGSNEVRLRISMYNEWQDLKIPVSDSDDSSIQMNIIVKSTLPKCGV